MSTLQELLPSNAIPLSPMVVLKWNPDLIKKLFVVCRVLGKDSYVVQNLLGAQTPPPPPNRPYNPMFLYPAFLFSVGCDFAFGVDQFERFSCPVLQFIIRQEQIQFTFFNGKLITCPFGPVLFHITNRGLTFCWCAIDRDCICNYIPIPCLLVCIDKFKRIKLQYFDKKFENTILSTTYVIDQSLIKTCNDFLNENFIMENLDLSGFLNCESVDNLLFTYGYRVPDFIKAGPVKSQIRQKNYIKLFENIAFYHCGIGITYGTLYHQLYQVLIKKQKIGKTTFKKFDLMQPFILDAFSFYPRGFIERAQDDLEAVYGIEAQGLFDGSGINVNLGDTTLNTLDVLIERLSTASLDLNLGKETLSSVRNLTKTLEDLSISAANVTAAPGILSDGISSFSSRMVFGGAASYIIYCTLRAFTGKNYTILGNVLTMVPMVAAMLPSQCCGLFDEFTKAIDENIVAQVDFTSIPWEPISMLALGAVHFITTGTTGKPFDSNSFMRLLSTLPKAGEGFTKVIGGFISILKFCIEYVKVELLGCDPSKDDSVAYPAVSSWLDAVREVVIKQKNLKLDITVNNFDHITRLQIEGMTIFKYSKFGSDGPAILSKVRYFMNFLDSARKPFEQSSIKTNLSRVEPLTILIRGSPGVGKSFMLKPFVHQLLAKILPKDQLDDLSTNPDSFVYNRMPEHEYWDGYRGQFVTLMDDFGQCVDVAGNLDNEYMSLIRGTNKFPYVLHMPDIADKGSNIFTSKVIVCTTNMMTFKGIESLRDTEALIRRFDYVIDLEVRPEFCEKREGDGGFKIKKGIPVTFDAWNLNVMKGYNLIDIGIIDSSYTFDGFVDLCSYKYQQKVSELSEYNRYCSIKLKEAIQRRHYFDGDILPDIDIDMGDIDEFEESREDFDELPENISKLGIDSTTWEKFQHYFLFCNKDWSYFAHPDHGSERMCLKIAHLKNRGLVDNFIRKIHSLSIYETVVNSLDHFKGFIADKILRYASIASDIVHKYPMLTILGTIATYITVVYAISSVFSPDAEGHYKQSKKVVRGKMRVRSGKGEYSNQGIDYEIQGDLNSTQIASKICKKNILLFCLPGCETIKSGTIIMLGGGIGLMPMHYYDIIDARMRDNEIDPLDYIEFRTPDGAKFMESTIGDMLSCERHQIPNKDIILFCLPGKTRIFPNIVNSFVTREQTHEFVYPRVNFYVVNEEGDFDVHNVEATMMPKPVKYNLGNRKIQSSDAFRLPVQTQRGDCGSPVLIDNAFSGPGKILGVHVAGVPSCSRAYSVTVFRDEIETCFNKFRSSIDAQGPPITDLILDRSFDTDRLDNKFFVLGKCSKYATQNSKTDLIKVDAFYGVLAPPTKAPAILSIIEIDGVKVDPLRNAIIKYSGFKPHIPDVLIDAATNSYYAFILRNSRKCNNKQILTFDESVIGIPECEFISSIPRTTSPGFPLTTERPFGVKGKKHWFGSDGDYDLNSPQCLILRENCSDIISKARNGVRSLHIYADHLKDETRPFDRVAIAKTRMISGAPLPFVIVFRQYFMRFSSWLMENRINNSIAVGTNPYSNDWDAIVLNLSEVGDNVIAGDFSGWDSNQFSEIGDHILRIINYWYNDGDENAKIRGILWLELYNSVHIYCDILYMWHKGMPSGNPFTTICNSIYNNIIIRMAWVDCHDRDLSSLNRFDKFVRTCTYGDDNLISVHDSVKDIFNVSNLSDCFKDYGQIYTDESKSVNSTTEFRRIRDVTFLKRHFVFDKKLNKWLCPLEFDVLEQMLNFVHGKSDFKTTVQQCYDSWKRELSLHSRNLFEEKLSIIRPIVEEEFNHYDMVNSHSAVRNLVLNEVVRY
jgi:hypothetical protein